MSRGKTLLLGIAMGVAGLVLYTRLQKVVEESDPERLIEKMEHDLAELEKRISAKEGNS